MAQMSFSKDEAECRHIVFIQERFGKPYIKARFRDSGDAMRYAADLVKTASLGTTVGMWREGFDDGMEEPGSPKTGAPRTGAL